MGHNDLGVRFVLENLTSTVFRRDTGLLKRLYLPLWYKCDVSTVSVIVSSMVQTVLVLVLFVLQEAVYHGGVPTSVWLWKPAIFPLLPFLVLLVLFSNSNTNTTRSNPTTILVCVLDTECGTNVP